MAAFHFAFFVRDLASTRRFYGEVLGCREGRSTDTWVDFDFFGNQISAHTTGSVTPTQNTGKVEDILVPMPHFGAILEWQEAHGFEMVSISPDGSHLVAYSWGVGLHVWDLGMIRHALARMGLGWSGARLRPAGDREKEKPLAVMVVPGETLTQGAKLAQTRQRQQSFH